MHSYLTQAQNEIATGMPFRQQPVFKRGRTTGTTAGYAERIFSDWRIDVWPPGITHRAALICNWPKTSATVRSPTMEILAPGYLIVWVTLLAF
jgi:hypothetical protein